MEKKKNTVNLNEKSRSNTRVEKNKNVNNKKIEIKKDFSIKKEISDENNSFKKYGFIALGLIVIAGLIFGGVKLFDKKESNEPEKKEEEKKVVPDDITPEEEDNDNNNGYITYVKKVNNEEKEQETEELIYRLTYVTNSDEDIESDLFEATEKTVEPAVPTKEGWAFDGWYKDVEFNEEFIYGSYLSSDTTVYAKWIKYIKFIKLGDEEPTVLDIKKVGENEIIPLYNKEGLVEEGYIPGWYILANDMSYEILEGTVLTEENFGDIGDTIELSLNPLKKLNVKFLYKETEESPTVEIIEKEVIQGRKIDFTDVDAKVAADYPDIEDYGWAYFENDSKWDFALDHVMTEDITEIYLVTYKYKIVYKEEIENVDPETNPEYKEINTIEYAGDTKIKVLEPEEKENKEFDGWYVEGPNGITDKKVDDEYLIEKDIEVIGKWNEIVQQFTMVPTQEQPKNDEDKSLVIDDNETLLPKEEELKGESEELKGESEELSFEKP